MSVRGPLGVGGISTTAMACGRKDGGAGCCNHVRGSVILGGAAPSNSKGSSARETIQKLAAMLRRMGKSWWQLGVCIDHPT